MEHAESHPAELPDDGQSDVELPTAEPPHAIEPRQAGERRIVCKPFLKWVGGKSQLLPELTRRLPTTFSRYFEPFVGGGALFFEAQPQHAFLIDTNPELINAYNVVRDSVEALIEDLQQHRYESEYFYHVRNVDRESNFADWSPVQRASRLIYLNKTCFNGLYRVNSKGHFNTPFGRYSNPTILDAQNLRACSRALQCARVQLGSFDEIGRTIQPDDFVYFDPPYVPLSKTANFTHYSRTGFDEQMQRDLQQLCYRLAEKGTKFMLSNSAAPLVLELYREFKIELVQATRAINSVASKRGPVDEVIVTNY